METQAEEEAGSDAATQENGAARLQSAKAWLQKPSGKNVIRAYRNHYAVDWKCAVRELEILGVELDWDYVRQVCGLTPKARDED